MKSKELQELTASEPLTLEQEYEMQKSWREDDDSKIIFANLAGGTSQDFPDGGGGATPKGRSSTYYLVTIFTTTAWKWKKLDRGCTPLDPPMICIW